MAKNTNRNTGIGIATIAVVGVLGVLAFTDLIMLPSELGTFGNELYTGEVVAIFPLSFTENAGVDCKMFSQLKETDVNGNTRAFAFNTVSFDVQTTFELVSTSSSFGVIRFLDTTARVSCDSVGGFVSFFDMVGKSTTTQIFATQESGQEILIKTINRSITSFPRDVLNQDLIIPTGSIFADEIDAKLTSTSENYVTRVRFVINTEFEFLGSSTGTLVNVAMPTITHKYTARVHNEIVDPPQPTSNLVLLESVTGADGISTTIDLADLVGGSVVIKVIGNLPQWSSSEGVPTFDVFDPFGNLVATRITMPVEQLIDPSTNTFRFTRPSFNLGSEIETGTWVVRMHSNQDVRTFLNGSPSTDTEFIRIIDTRPIDVICPTGTIEIIVNGIVIGCEQPPSTCPVGLIFDPVSQSCQLPILDECPVGLEFIEELEICGDPNADQDSDGVQNSLDACPNTPFGAVVNSAGCESPVRPKDPNCQADDVIKGLISPNGQCTIIMEEPPVTIEEFLSGQIRSAGTIVFTDNSVQTFVVGDTNFLTGVGSIQPLSVTLSVSGEDKNIERFEYEVFYIYPNTADALATFLVDTDIRFTPTVIVSSVESRTGTSSEGLSDSIGVNGEVQIPTGTTTSVGFGISLGKGLILGKQVQALVTQEDPVTGDPAPIGEGVAKPVIIQINADGDFTLRRETTTSTFVLNDAFVSFSGVTINNRVTPPPSPCPSGTVPLIDEATGEQFGCGQPDSDGDGIPNDRDQCPNVAGARSNNGCPIDTIDQCPQPIQMCTEGSTFNVPTCRCEVDDQSCPSGEQFNPSKQMCEVKPLPIDQACKDGTLFLSPETGEIICVKGDIVIVGKGDNGEVCSLAEPQNCPSPVVPFDLNTLLVVGGVGFIIIGVTVVILRRR